MTSGLFCLNSLNRTGSLLVEGVSGFFLLLPCFIEVHVFNANSVDPDQMLHPAASDLGLHCLPMFHLQDARIKWIKSWDRKRKKLWKLKI